MKRKRSRRRERMEEIAFIKATTRFLSEDQYLGSVQCGAYRAASVYFVTLNTLRSRRARSAERPKEPARSRMFTQTTWGGVESVGSAHLKDGADDHNAVESVEGRAEVCGQAERVHPDAWAVA
jgi:hypothetical protein